MQAQERALVASHVGVARVAPDRVQRLLRPGRLDPPGRAVIAALQQYPARTCNELWALALTRVAWHHHVRRLDVTRMERIADALRVLTFITDPWVTAHILEHLGLTSDVVPIAPARAPPDAPVSEPEFGA